MEKKYVFDVDEVCEIVSKAIANVYYERHKDDASFSIPKDVLKVAIEAANLGGSMMLDKTDSENDYILAKAERDFCLNNNTFDCAMSLVIKNGDYMLLKVPEVEEYNKYFKRYYTIIESFSGNLIFPMERFHDEILKGHNFYDFRKNPYVF